MNKTVIAHDASEMEEIGVELGSHVRSGFLVSVIGQLGAGKTTLVKGLARSLLITDVVCSPSYLLARNYTGRSGTVLHHIDAYRVASLDALAEVGLDVYLPPEAGVSVVEWPDNIDGLVEQSNIVVRIRVLENEAREITITQGEA
ncbi:tRNA (adenosine(37)-N6)-threonylcarbamoyltransferase complex ATPase subunit type 1 TsaE [Candidatus Bipolaricaulota bacterium]|nr:tRNA (adenosine(37)-N6)-threonylcarbamoyltransferase complex ATPase subunit type 1 TsaE [Candidatus Bipolaricaulota bacterium]